MIKANNITTTRVFTAFFSLVLSVYLIYADDLINSDGILYIDVAEAYLAGGTSEAVKLYNWPFLSILMAYIHQITTLSIESSAYLLNTLFFVLLTDILVLLSAKVVPNRQVSIAAAIILLFATLNDYRNFIIRDVGYWYLSSLALYLYLEFIDRANFKNALLWQLSTLSAILFRIEGVVLLLALPLHLFFYFPIKKAIRKYLKINLLIIIGGILALSLTGIEQPFNKITTVTKYLDVEQLFAQISTKAGIISNQVLNLYSAKYGVLILISGLFVMLGFKLIKAMTFSYLILFLSSRWQSKPSIVTSEYKVILYFAVINIIILTLFMLNQFFISTRYAILGLLSFLLLMMPALCRFVKMVLENKRGKLLLFIFIALLINFIDSLHKSGSKVYIKKTAIWASQNLPDGSQVLTDDTFLHYYFRTNHNYATINKIDIGNYTDNCYKPSKIINAANQLDYLIVVEKRKNTKLKKALPSMPLSHLQSFENERGDKASVYKIIKAPIS